MAVVSALAIAPVKATHLRSVPSVRLERVGVRENRRFYLIDARGRMVNGKRFGELNAVLADYSDVQRRLALTFPDGKVLEGPIELGETVDTRFYSHRTQGRIVHGPWSQTLSEYVGQSLRLVEAGAVGGALDRGAGGAVSLISRASLARLAEASGERDVDPRRFRMLIEIEGVPAHAEDEWVGATVRIGAAVIVFKGHVGRCLITSRDPDTGKIDLPTLEILGSYRSRLDTTEPLPFGIYGEVREEGTVSVGDEVSPPDTRPGP